MITTADDLDTRAGVLSAVRDEVATVMVAECNKMVLAVAWAAMHSTDSMDDAACYPGFESELALAGPGAPLVAEFAVAELAVALHITTDAGRAFLGLAMELRYRLPRVWKRVTAGDLAPWRARKVAEQPMTLSMEAAGFVDAHVAAFAHKIGHARLERLVEEAVTRFMPAEAEQRRRAAAEHRHFDIHTRHTTAEGVVDVTGTLDLADALDLDAAVTQGAADLEGPRLRGVPRRPSLPRGGGDGEAPAHPRPQRWRDGRRRSRTVRRREDQGAAGGPVRTHLPG